MSGATPKQPLPLAPDRSALMNRISLLLTTHDSKASSLLSSTMTFKRPAAKPPVKDDDRFSNPNHGVGYVPVTNAAQPTEQTKRDEQLRKKLLGKRRRGWNDDVLAREEEVGGESESEDEGGRSAVGRVKKVEIRRKPVDDGEGQVKKPETKQAKKAEKAKGQAEPLEEAESQQPNEQEAEPQNQEPQQPKEQEIEQPKNQEPEIKKHPKDDEAEPNSAPASKKRKRRNKRGKKSE